MSVYVTHACVNTNTIIIQWFLSIASIHKTCVPPILYLRSLTGVSILSMRLVSN